MTRRIGLFFFIICCALSSAAQEVVFPLGSNMVLQNAASEQQSSMLFRTVSISDTVTLPFNDDFSVPGIYPQQSLWLDSGAFINTTFADRPVTIGIATLDGLDKSGVPYDSNSGISRICDHLTSNPIDLD